MLSPALGGLVIGHAVAAALGVPFRFCERRDGAMELRRGFRLRPGERVVVIEDVITTGGSAAEAAALAAAAGAEVVAVGAIILRGAAPALATPAGRPAAARTGQLGAPRAARCAPAGRRSRRPAAGRQPNRPRPPIRR